MSQSFSIPDELLRRLIRVVRPRDLRSVYTNPNPEVKRLAAKGVLLHLAHGYYAVPPMEWIGDSRWVPTVESVALGIAAADHGEGHVAIVGMSAARVLGHYPRALGVAIVAVPVRRHSLQTSAGKVHFWQRPIQKMQTQSWRSELGLGRVGTAEQTMLDIAERPDRGGVSVGAAQEALRALALVVDWNRALELATSQGSMASYARARWFSDALVPDAPNPGILRRPVASRRLKPIGDTSRQRFGIRDD